MPAGFLVPQRIGGISFMNHNTYDPFTGTYPLQEFEVPTGIDTFYFTLSGGGGSGGGGVQNAGSGAGGGPGGAIYYVKASFDQGAGVLTFDLWNGFSTSTSPQPVTLDPAYLFNGHWHWYFTIGKHGNAVVGTAGVDGNDGNAGDDSFIYFDQTNGKYLHAYGGDAGQGGRFTVGNIALGGNAGSIELSGDNGFFGGSDLCSEYTTRGQSTPYMLAGASSNPGMGGHNVIGGFGGNGGNPANGLSGISGPGCDGFMSIIW